MHSTARKRRALWNVLDAFGLPAGLVSVWGTQPPEASWGGMLNTARSYIDLAWWLSVFPGAAIMLVVLGFNFLGDGLRDILDPRLGPSVGSLPEKK